MLEQGTNIEGLDIIVIMSYYSKSKSLIQRIGRLRKEGMREGHVIIFRTTDTVEEKWFNKMFDSSDNAYKTIQYEGVKDFIEKSGF